MYSGLKKKTTKPRRLYHFGEGGGDSKIFSDFLAGEEVELSTINYLLRIQGRLIVEGTRCSPYSSIFFLVVSLNHPFFIRNLFEMYLG